jgi:hypothetical protein
MYGGQTAPKKNPIFLFISQYKTLSWRKLKQNISFKLDSNVLNVAGAGHVPETTYPATLETK